MQTFKITTRLRCAKYYFIYAVNEEDARQKVFGGEVFGGEYHDPTYGEVEEEVHEIVAINN